MHSQFAIQQSPVPVSCLVMSERVIGFCFMDTDRATLDDLAILRVAFEDGTPLGWEAVHAFEEQQGIVLPEPYRTCVAEITDGAAGPPDYGMVKLGNLPERWAWPERDLTKPFPLSEAWIWETTSVRMRSSARCWMPSTITARSYLAPTPAQCTGT